MSKQVAFLACSCFVVAGLIAYFLVRSYSEGAPSSRPPDPQDASFAVGQRNRLEKGGAPSRPVAASDMGLQGGSVDPTPEPAREQGMPSREPEGANGAGELSQRLAWLRSQAARDPTQQTARLAPQTPEQRAAFADGLLGRVDGKFLSELHERNLERMRAKLRRDLSAEEGVVAQQAMMRWADAKDAVAIETNEAIKEAVLRGASTTTPQERQWLTRGTISGVLSRTQEWGGQGGGVYVGFDYALDAQTSPRLAAAIQVLAECESGMMRWTGENTETKNRR